MQLHVIYSYQSEFIIKKTQNTFTKVVFENNIFIFIKVWLLGTFTTVERGEISHSLATSTISSGKNKVRDSESYWLRLSKQV